MADGTRTNSNVRDMITAARDLAVEYKSRDMANVLREAGKQNINIRSGFIEIVLNASVVNATPYVYEGSGYKLIVAMQGTTPGLSFDILFDSGTKLTQVSEGLRMTGKFGRFTIQNPSSIWGTIRLIVVKQEDGDYEEQPTNTEGVLNSKTRVGIAQGSTLDIPVQGTDGLAVDGCKGVRCLLSADAGQTITGGTIVFWAYDVAQTRWCEVSNLNETINPLAGTARRDYMSSEYPILIGAGRIFVECRNVTVSAGSLSQTLTVG